jgi:hypothetical protein
MLDGGSMIEGTFETVMCCHCQGEGTVSAEVNEHSGEYLPQFTTMTEASPPPVITNSGEVPPLYVEPHAYVPDVSHYMGDCAVCGHIQSNPVHI